MLCHERQTALVDAERRGEERRPQRQGEERRQRDADRERIRCGPVALWRDAARERANALRPAAAATAPEASTAVTSATSSTRWCTTDPSASASTPIDVAHATPPSTFHRANRRYGMALAPARSGVASRTHATQRARKTAFGP